MLHLIFLVAAVIGGTVMICQFALTLMGMGDDGSDLPDGDFDGGTPDHATDWNDAADGDYQHPDSTWLFGVLSFRTLVAAAAFFGVAGETALSAGYSKGIAVAIAVLVGISAMYGMYWLMEGLSRLTSSGNERISAAVGKHATVYIPIPAEERGVGKVHVTIQNRTVEYQAISAEPDPLRTGETVKIVGVKNSDTVAVRKVREPVVA